jgi:hypothetical protein
MNEKRIEKLAENFMNFEGLVEGDDGIFVCEKEIPTQLIEDLGIYLKLEYASDYTHASFCGICKPARNAQGIITDPTKWLSEMCLIKTRYQDAKETVKDGLVRAKALSALDNLPYCPIVSVFAAAVLEKTRGKQHIFEKDNYRESEQRQIELRMKTDQFHKLTAVQAHERIHLEQRLAVESKYGYSVPFQLDWERKCIEWVTNREVNFPSNEKIDVLLRNFDEMKCTEKKIETYCRQWKSKKLDDPRTFFIKEDGSIIKKSYAPATKEYDERPQCKIRKLYNFSGMPP